MKLLAYSQEITRICCLWLCGQVNRTYDEYFFLVHLLTRLFGVTVTHVLVISKRKIPVQSVIIISSFGKYIWKLFHIYFIYTLPNRGWDWTGEASIITQNYWPLIINPHFYSIHIAAEIVNYRMSKTYQTRFSMSQMQILGKQQCFGHGIGLLLFHGFSWLCVHAYSSASLNVRFLFRSICGTSELILTGEVLHLQF